LQLAGGPWSCSTEYVGSSGSGSFTNSSGTNTVSGNLYLGYSAAGNGTYLLGGL